MGAQESKHIGVVQLRSSLDGDYGVVQNALKEKQTVFGFFGPSAHSTFHTKLADGSIVHNEAWPVGFVKLFGPILPTLDGPLYKIRASLLARALNPAQYIDVVRTIFHDEHAAWAAHGGQIPLAANSKLLALKIFSAVVLGLDDDAFHQPEVAPLIAKFQDALRDSTKVVSDEAKSLKKRIVDALVHPAIESSHDRIAHESNQTHRSAVDFLVATKQLEHEVLEAELFYLLVFTLPRLERLLIHSISSYLAFPHTRKLLTQAKDDYVAKYSTQEARWSNLTDTGYIRQFVQEVTRYYVAGSATYEFGRTTRTIEEPFQYTIPKGSLVVAGIAQDSPDQGVFDPTRFAAGNATKPLDSIDAELIDVVGVGAFVSLLDFEWTMAKGQNVLDPTKGQLLAVGFKYRTSTAFDAPEAKPWMTLTLEGVPQDVSSVETLPAFFSDRRLDFWTHSMIQLVAVSLSTPTRLTTAAIHPPKRKVPLRKVQPGSAKILVPVDDEDLEGDNWLSLRALAVMRNVCPFVDNFDDDWAPGEDKEEYVRSKVGDLLPVSLVNWSDKYSDRALSLLAFAGMGQHIVTKLPAAHDDGSYYGLLLNFLDSIEVRPGFAKYGADAFFDKAGQIVKIVRGGVTYRPNDDAWEYVKACFRGSLLVKVTAIDHLLGVHCTASNYLTTANREQLSPDHPIRRLIKPFTFRTVVVNHDATWTLFTDRGFLHRATAFTSRGFDQTWEYGLTHFKFETIPERLARQNIDTVVTPFAQDGLDFWNVLHAFVSDYVDLYFATDADVVADAELRAFWQFLTTTPGWQHRQLGLASLKDVITQGFMWVTALHNYIGGVGEYIMDPEFCPSAWLEGEIGSRPGPAVRTAIILSATNLTMPSILEDFSHIMLDDKAKQLCHRFSNDMMALADIIQARNRERDHPFTSFDPATVELSVSF
ncbi:unnamed protein product [Aphanomyces euteiches]